MPVSTFVQPNYNTQSGTAYPLNIDAAFAAFPRLAGAFAPHEQATPNMTVRLDAGHIFAGGSALTEVPAQSTGTITAPSANSRKDIVHVDRATGAVGVATGTEAASPVDPAIPAGKVPVARINLTTSTATITNSIIDDIRSLNLLGLASGATTTVASGATTTVGTAATRNTGTAAGDIPLLETGGKLPAVDGSQLTGIVSVPTGAVMPYAGSTEPSGWKYCAGQAISRTAFAALFTAIGTTFGVGDGSTTFNLPDLRGRAAVGKDDMNGSAASRVTSGGSGIAGATLGASGGAETVTLATAQMPAHTHIAATFGGIGQGGGVPNLYPGETTGSNVLTSSTGGGGAHQNMPPALILNYIVKT